MLCTEQSSFCAIGLLETGPSALERESISTVEDAWQVSPGSHCSRTQAEQGRDSVSPLIFFLPGVCAPSVLSTPQKGICTASCETGARAVLRVTSLCIYRKSLDPQAEADGSCFGKRDSGAGTGGSPC